jgi:hypothetical protein
MPKPFWSVWRQVFVMASRGGIMILTIKFFAASPHPDATAL